MTLAGVVGGFGAAAPVFKAEDGKLTTEITSERRMVKVNEAWFGSVGSMNLKADVRTYKCEVEDVKRMEGNCSSASAAQ